jgi:hypothetical protein
VACNPRSTTRPLRPTEPHRGVLHGSGEAQERWFTELTNRKLRRSAHRSVTELETDVRRWINEWNANPKPFVWIKTADKILNTLAASAHESTTQDISLLDLL